MLKRTGQLLALPILVAALLCTGCCTRTRPTRKVAVDDRQKMNFDKTEAVEQGQSKTELNLFQEPVLAEREKDRRTQELYRKFEHSHQMFLKANFDGALREIDRIQMEISDDPYLEMQTWYLSAMIYHKTAKGSRRNRAMRKMLQSLETLQKDPRFRESFEDGMMCQQVIDMAIEKETGKYDAFE